MPNIYKSITTEAHFSFSSVFFPFRILFPKLMTGPHCLAFLRITLHLTSFQSY